MWPRWIELLLAGWLLLAPFVVDAGTGYALSHFATGAAVAAAAALALWRRSEAARAVIAIAALWLVAHGYLAAPRPGPLAAQNEIVVGLTLLMFVVIPNEANAPPKPWRRS